VCSQPLAHKQGRDETLEEPGQFEKISTNFMNIRPGGENGFSGLASADEKDSRIEQSAVMR
jgi:hypothetical protein